MKNSDFYSKALSLLSKFMDGFDYKEVKQELESVNNTIYKEIETDIKENFPGFSQKTEEYVDLLCEGPVTRRRYGGNIAAMIYDYRMWLTKNYRAIVKPKIVPQDTERAKLIDEKIGDKRLYRQGHKGTTKDRKMTSGRQLNMMRQYYESGAMIGALSSANMAKYMFHPEDCVIVSSGVPFEIFKAMDLTPYAFNVHGNLRPMDQRATLFYLDKVAEMGITSDTCSFPRVPAGVALAHHFFEGMKCGVFCNITCDGAMRHADIVAREMNIPVFSLDHPYRFKGEDGMQCFIEEMYEMIEFLEKHTGHTMDWDKFEEACYYTNEIQKCEMERWEMQRLPNPPSAADLMLSVHLTCVLGPLGASKEGLDIIKRQVDIMKDSVKKNEGVIRDLRYRAVMWNPPPSSFANFSQWMEQCWGTVILNDMETFGWFGSIDMTNRETMMRGVAEKCLSSTMSRHTRGDISNFFDDLWKLCDMYQPDFLIMADHIGCHPANGLTGALTDGCRERGIKLMRIHQDLADVRIASHQEVRNQANTFMTSVMNATPLDEDLMVYDDSNEW